MICMYLCIIYSYISCWPSCFSSGAPCHMATQPVQVSGACWGRVRQMVVASAKPGMGPQSRENHGKPDLEIISLSLSKAYLHFHATRFCCTVLKVMVIPLGNPRFSSESNLVSSHMAGWKIPYEFRF